MLHSLCQYYLVWCTPGIFLSGLILGHSMVENGVIRILIDYISESWNDIALRDAVIIVSAQDGLTSILMIFTAYITDAYIGRFNAILYTTVAFIGGIVLLWSSNPTSNPGIYLVMMVLIAFGQSGRESPLIAFRQSGREQPLIAFLADHVRRINNSLNYNYDQVEARTIIWWGVPHYIGAVLAIFVLGILSWKNKFIVSTIVMVATFLVFLMGYPKYQPKCVTGSTLTTVYRVFKNAIIRRSIDYSHDPGDYYKNDHDDKPPLEPRILFFNWIDKAAIKGDASTSSVEEQEEKGEICPVTQVKEVKTLLTMIPMWSIFFIHCLVIASGNTFFFQQTSNLNDRIGSRFRFPISALYVLQKSLNQVASIVCDSVIEKWFKKKKLLATKARIGIGLACSCLCCIVARLVEVKRLDKVTKEEFIDVENKIVGMSILWLLPQFGLLGLSQGFTETGLLRLFYYQVAESIKEYGPPFNEFVLGIGKFISIFWVLTFRGWIGDEINVSRLDNYYGILAICSMGNLFFIYGSISRYFYKHAKGEDLFVDPMEQFVVVLEQETTN